MIVAWYFDHFDASEIELNLTLLTYKVNIKRSMMVNEEVELLKTLVLDLETELKTKGIKFVQDQLYHKVIQSCATFINFSSICVNWWMGIHKEGKGSEPLTIPWDLV